MKKIILCTWCINGLRSHGEKVFVGDEIDYDEYYDEHGCTRCEFCGEEDSDEQLYECMI